MNARKCQNLTSCTLPTWLEKLSIAQVLSALVLSLSASMVFAQDEIDANITETEAEIEAEVQEAIPTEANSNENDADNGSPNDDLPDSAVTEVVPEESQETLSEVLPESEDPLEAPASEDLESAAIEPEQESDTGLDDQANLDSEAEPVDPEYVSETDTVDVEYESDAPLSAEIEDLKKASMELNRDLLILEEELLFPDSTQIVIFVSMDVGEFFKLDSVRVSIDEKVVATHLYTNRQNLALIKGGVQRLYMGNVKSGDHEITAILNGMGPDNREYKRGATTVINKDDDIKMIELMIRDSTQKMQPEFEFKEWEL